MDALQKVDNWRCRATELRHMAGGMHETATRSSLLKMAVALEQHAVKLEAVTLLCRLRRRPEAALRRTG